MKSPRRWAEPPRVGATKRYASVSLPGRSNAWRPHSNTTIFAQRSNSDVNAPVVRPRLAELAIPPRAAASRCSLEVPSRLGEQRVSGAQGAVVETGVDAAELRSLGAERDPGREQ